MITNFTESEFSAATSTTLLPCHCYNCDNVFLMMKKNIVHELKHRRGRVKFCSFKCLREYLRTKQMVTCTNCGEIFEKNLFEVKKSTNHFCSQSCSGVYTNTHRNMGIRRSKLEAWLEIKLIEQYPNFEIQFNRKDAINSELDIYIPSLKLAFELNGIFHYEPIYGNDKLNQIGNNDNRKFQACIERGIELCIIDTSTQKNFKEKSSKKFLDIITSFIDNKLNV
jgi:hypothetical protein